MQRTARYAPGGMVFHVLNRGVSRMRLFLTDADFQAFERIVEKERVKGRGSRSRNNFRSEWCVNFCK